MIPQSKVRGNEGTTNIEDNYTYHNRKYPWGIPYLMAGARRASKNEIRDNRTQ